MYRTCKPQWGGCEKCETIMKSKTHVQSYWTIASLLSEVWPKLSGILDTKDSLVWYPTLTLDYSLNGDHCWNTSNLRWMVSAPLVYKLSINCDYECSTPCLMQHNEIIYLIRLYVPVYSIYAPVLLHNLGKTVIQTSFNLKHITSCSSIQLN